MRTLLVGPVFTFALVALLIAALCTHSYRGTRSLTRAMVRRAS